MIKELCVENFTNIPAAIKAGATRIELCDNLAVGGTTVSKGVLQESCRYLQEQHMPVMVMIRPRGGNFVYNDIELKIMESDIFTAQEAGADGIVFGCLTPDNRLDEEAIEMLIGAAGGMQLTFHMAFDELAADYQIEALNWLAAAGIDNILTHGGTLDQSIEATIPHLQELIKAAGQSITILPGGGIHASNLEKIAAALSVPAFHGTKIVNL